MINRHNPLINIFNIHTFAGQLNCNLYARNSLHLFATQQNTRICCSTWSGRRRTQILGSLAGCCSTRQHNTLALPLHIVVRLDSTTLLIPHLMQWHSSNDSPVHWLPASWRWSGWPAALKRQNAVTIINPEPTSHNEPPTHLLQHCTAQVFSTAHHFTDIIAPNEHVSNDFDCSFKGRKGWTVP